VVVTADGQRLERTRKLRDGTEARRELEELVREQLADGFVETTAPAWQTFLNSLVEYWQHDAPSFDAKALQTSVMAPARPSPQEMVEATMRLADRWIAQTDGSTVLDFDHSDSDAASAWLRNNLPATLPILQLALRHPDYAAQLRVEAILGEAGGIEALPALLSVVEFSAANLASHLGGRPQHFPMWAIKRCGEPTDETGSTLIRLLDHEDFRIAGAAAKILAECATVDKFFQALLAKQDRAKREDDYAWALMRAAEVRRDPLMRPYLEWMLKNRRFKSAGYPQRIREAIAALRS
jgi:hypothetical protein